MCAQLCHCPGATRRHGAAKLTAPPPAQICDETELSSYMGNCSQAFAQVTGPARPTHSAHTRPSPSTPSTPCLLSECARFTLTEQVGRQLRTHPASHT